MWACRSVCCDASIADLNKADLRPFILVPKLVIYCKAKSMRNLHIAGATLAALVACCAFGFLPISPVQAAGQMIDGVNIVEISVNGGSDTINPGTTCIKLSVVVSASCPAGFIAIQNNNKQLLAAALQAKANASRTLIYYDDGPGSYHCPGFVVTPCSVVSINLR